MAKTYATPHGRWRARRTGSSLARRLYVNRLIQRMGVAPTDSTVNAIEALAEITTDAAMGQGLGVSLLEPLRRSTLDPFWTNAPALRGARRRRSSGLLLDTTSETARSSQREPSVALDDMYATLPARHLATLLGGISDETVRRREREGALFSVLPPGRLRGREYPVLQTWPGVAGAPLQSVLSSLPGQDGASAFLFLTGSHEDFAGLTPVEMLCGGLTPRRAIDAEASSLLQEPPNARLDRVLNAALAYRDTVAG